MANLLDEWEKDWQKNTQSLGGGNMLDQWESDAIQSGAISAPKPPADEGILSNIFKGAKVGAANTVGGVAGWIGGNNAVTDWAEDVAQSNQRSREHDGYDLDYFLNGSGLAYDFGNLLGSFASMAPVSALIPEAVGGAAAAGAASLLGRAGASALARRAAIEAAKKGGGALGGYARYGLGAGTAEALAEGGSGVTRAFEEGVDNPYAVGAEIFAKNWPLLVGSQALEGGILHKGFSRLGGKAGESLAKRAGLAPFRAAPYAAAEGLTEATQEVMQERAQEEAFNEPTGGLFPSDMTENERKALYATFAPAALLGGIGGVRGSMRAKGNEPESKPAPYVANWDNGMNGLDTDLFDKWESAPGMTDLTGVRRDVVAALNGLANEYGGKITITGAAEKGVHAEGEDGHEGGWKVDIEKNLADPEKFLELAAKYGFAVGDEGDHYDLSANRKGGVGGKQVATPDAFVSDDQQPSGQREGHENAWAIYDVFKAAGYNDNAIAGILGRVQQEHNFDTSDVPEHEEEGKHLGGYGMFQWNGGRTTAFLNWARENGLDPQSATTQAQYALLEAQQRGLTPEKMNQLSHEEAADLWTSDWEVGKPGDERKYAGEWLTRLQNGGGVAGGTTTSTRAPQAQQEPQIDTYDDVYEAFAKEMSEHGEEGDRDFFKGMFDGNDNFNDTEENRRKIDERYGEELKEFADVYRNPSVQTQIDRLIDKAVEAKDYNRVGKLQAARRSGDIQLMRKYLDEAKAKQGQPNNSQTETLDWLKNAWGVKAEFADGVPQEDIEKERENVKNRFGGVWSDEQNAFLFQTEEQAKAFHDYAYGTNYLEEGIPTEQQEPVVPTQMKPTEIPKGEMEDGNTQSTQSTQAQADQAQNAADQNKNVESGQAEEGQVGKTSLDAFLSTLGLDPARVQAERDNIRDMHHKQLAGDEASSGMVPHLDRAVNTDFAKAAGNMAMAGFQGKKGWERGQIGAALEQALQKPATAQQAMDAIRQMQAEDEAAYFNGDVHVQEGVGRSRKPVHIRSKDSGLTPEAQQKYNQKDWQDFANREGYKGSNEAAPHTKAKPTPKKKSKALSQFKKNVAEVVDKYRNDETTYEKAFQKIADMQVAAERVAPDEATVQEIRQVAEDGINQLNAIFAEKQETPSQTAQESAGEQETPTQVEEPTQEEKPAQSEAESNEGGEKSAQNATVEENSTVANKEKPKKDYSSMSLDELKAERQKWIDEEVARWKKNPGGKGSNNGLIYSEYDPVTGKPTGEVTGRTSESLNPDWYQWAYKRNGNQKPAKRDYPMFADEYLRNTQEYDELVNEIERREAEPKQEKPTKKQESAEGKVPAQESQFGDEAENEKDFLEALGITEDETEEVSFGNEFGDTTDEEIEALKKELQKELSKLSANPVFNPKIYTLGLQLGGKYIQKGYRTFKKWLEKMTSDLGKNIEPWAPAIWETLKTYPKGQKFDPKQVMACSKLIGSKFERGVTSLEDVNADMKKLLKGRYKEFAPMIEASYNGIEKYFSTIKEGENNVNDSTRGLASRTGEGVNKDSVGRNDESGRPSRGSKREGRQEAEHDVQQQDSAGIYDSSPSRGGKAGNSGVQAEESADRSGGTRDTELSGSVRDSYEGSVALDDGRKAEDINPAEERPINAAAEKVSKEKANTPYKAGDLDSIKADLPMLRPEQQEDVQRIEKRLFVDKGQGFLCTNGTGTGKTYSGLGVIKRAYDQGKKNILVVAPKAEIIKQWIEAAKTDFSLDIKQLSDTKDNGGKGICITTYANFQANRELAARDWDMIVADESHTLLENKDASETSALKMLRSLTEHPRQLYNRWKLKNRTKKIRALENKLDEYESKLAKLVADHNKHKVSDSVYGERSVSLKNSIKQTENAIAEEYRSMNDQWKEVEKQWKAIPSEDKPKVLFMSATPFAYDKSIDYAEGYLFNYNEDTNPGSYHNQSGFEQFMIQKFGYRFRYGKLAKPEAQVDNRVMEIQFHDDLVDAGVMYGRQIDLPVDYDRGFLLVDGGIGNKIDEGFKFLWDNNKKYGKLAEALRKQFDTRAKRYLIESIKAKAVVPIVQEYIKSGKKVVLFHQSMKEKLNVHPFQLKNFSDRQVTEQWELFKKERPDLVGLRFDDIPAPMTTLKSAFKDALYLDGSQENKKSRNNAVKLFQDDDSGKNLIICQQDAANAGVSLHDTTGKHQRVLINIATPERPIYAMQIEGRIYRVGSVTNAIFRYLSTGTELEKYIFANTIGSRAETSENLALGADARGLQDSFTNLFMETLDDSWERRKPGHPEEGTGGKEMDFSGKSDVTLWERAKSFYYGQQKKTSSTKAQEGRDYFATPEPIGLKMVEWLGLKDGDSALEPSAGHGAISRWFSPNTNNTIVEPSGKLAPLAQMVTPEAKVVQDNFENFNVVNKFDGIAMNPPFGQGGKTAVDHIAKAFRHLKDGGRLIAILPQGPSADAHFDRWFYGLNKKGEQVEDGVKNGVLTADISLPGVTFNRAGTGVATRIVVIDKHNNEGKQQKAWEKGGQQVDLSNIQDINELFERMENMTVPERVTATSIRKEKAESNNKQYVLPAETKKGNKTVVAAIVNDAEGVTSDDVKELAKTYNGKYDAATDSFEFDFKEERNDFIRAANDLLAKSKNPPELRDSYPAEIDGTPITIHSDGRITGKTYDIKDTIKENGGKWDRDSRVWRINDPAKLTKFINKYNTEDVQVDEQEEDTSTAFDTFERNGKHIAAFKELQDRETFKSINSLAKDKYNGKYVAAKGFVFDTERDMENFVEEADALLGTEEKTSSNRKYSIDGKPIVGVRKYSAAWHGTAATGIDRLSLQYIGTGEGAQVHGYGLYFAANSKVSQGYRDMLAGNEGITVSIDGTEYTKIETGDGDIEYRKDGERLSSDYSSVELSAADYFIEDNGDKNKAIETVKAEIENLKSYGDKYLDAIRDREEIIHVLESADIKTKNKGSLLQVEIPDESEMLDEQRPIDDQPARYALHDILESALEDSQLRNWAKNELPASYKADMSREQVVNLLWDSMKVKNGGRDFYQGLARWAMETEGKANPKAASELLNTYGIPGITYNGGRDGRCYVVFDDEAIEIIQRLSVAKGKASKRSMDELKAEVKEAFPGAKVEDQGDTLKLTMPNGQKVTVALHGNITVNEQEEAVAKASHGFDQSASVTIEGYAETVGAEGFIALSQGSREGTGFHEAYHIAEAMAFTKKELADAKRLISANEEERADAYAKWKLERKKHSNFAKLWQKIADVAAKLAGILGYETKRNIFRKLESGEIYQRDNTARNTPRQYSVNASDNSTSSYKQRVKNFFMGKQDAPSHRRMLKNMMEEIADVKISYGKLDEGMEAIYKSAQKVIRVRNANDWEKVVPLFAKAVCDKIGIKADKALTHYISDWIQTGAPNNNSAEADTFAQAMREHPEIADQLLDLQSAFMRWNQMDAMERMQSIVSRREKEKTSISSMLDYAYDQIVEELGPVKRLVKQIEGKIGKQENALNPYVAFRLFRGHHGRAMTMLEGSGADMKAVLARHYPNLNWDGFKTLHEILDSIGGLHDEKIRDEFGNYALACHVYDIHLQNDQTEMQIDMLKKQLASTTDAEKQKELQEKIDRLDRSIMMTPISRTDCGKIIREYGKKYGQAQQDLVHFSNMTLAILKDSGVISETRYARILRRWPNYVPMFRVFDENENKNFGDSLKALEGSTRDVIDPLESIIRNTFDFVKKAEKNKAKCLLARLAQVSDVGKYIEPVDNNKPNDDTVITYYVDGQKRYLQTDPSVVAAVNGMGIDQSNLLMKILRFPARLARSAFTVTNPAFLIRNSTRDMQDAFIYNDRGTITPMNFVRAFMHAFRKDDIYWEWMSSGAAQASAISIDRDYAQATLDKMTKSWKQMFKDNPVTFPFKAFLDATERLAEFSEMGTRIAAYERTKKALVKDGAALTNMDLAEAAYESRDLMDFARGGKASRQWNSLAIFANASIQGWDKFFRTFNVRKDPKAAMRAMARLAIGGMLPALLLTLANWDEDWWKEIPDWQKDSHWILAPNVRIPKGQDIGLRFVSSLIEKGLDAMHNNNPLTAKRALKPIYDQTPDILPTAMLPVIEAMTNYSFFKEAPIVPQYQKDLPAKLQYSGTTSGLAKALGDLLNYSPRKIDHLIQGYTGSVGKGATSAMDMARGEKRMNTAVEEMPVFSGFMMTPYKNAATVEKFYQEFRKQTEGDKAFKATHERMEGYSPAKYKRMSQANRKMSELNKKERKLLDDNRISPERKQELQAGIQRQRIAIAKRAMGVK